MSETDDVAVASRGGVRVVATLDDWRGLKEELPDAITPIKIRVVNQSDRPVSILYDHFTLVGRHGRRYHVVPAVPLDHAALLAGMGPIRPVFATSNFEVAGRYHDIYPQLEPWPTPLRRDDRLYEAESARWKGRAPDGEVCRMELPEGVLEPGGEITGYLYFEDPTGTEKALTLHAELGSGRDGAKVASIKIPLAVE